MDPSFFNQHSHTTLIDGIKQKWQVKRLWVLAADLPIFDYPVSSFNKFDDDLWFCNHTRPTINNFLVHYNRVKNADLSFPIIISQQGLVMDGIHRILKAHLEGLKYVKAVQFKVNPDPDEIG